MFFSQVVQFAHDDMESKNCDASIVIIDVSREERDKVEDNIRTGTIEKSI